MHWYQNPSCHVGSYMMVLVSCQPWVIVRHAARLVSKSPTAPAPASPNNNAEHRSQNRLPNWRRAPTQHARNTNSLPWCMMFLLDDAAWSSQFQQSQKLMLKFVLISWHLTSEPQSTLIDGHLTHGIGYHGYPTRQVGHGFLPSQMGKTMGRPIMSWVGYRLGFPPMGNPMGAWVNTKPL